MLKCMYTLGCRKNLIFILQLLIFTDYYLDRISKRGLIRIRLALILVSGQFFYEKK